MQNLFEIMQRAGGGAYLETLSRQYGLDPASTQKALDALLPAFSIAFQQSLQNPERFSALLDTMLSGSYGHFYDRGLAQPGPAGMEALIRLFGSPDTVHDISRRAAEATGIGARVLQEMMPAVAATLIGGVMRSLTAEGMADMLRQWSEILRRVADQTHPPAPRMPTDPWSAWLDMMTRFGAMGSGGGQTAQRGANPFEAWAQSFGAAMGIGQPKPPPPPPETSEGPNPFEVLAKMFETGREVQSQYLATLQSLLTPPGDSGTRA